MKMWLILALALLLLSIPTVVQANNKDKDCGKGVPCGNGQTHNPHNQDQDQPPTQESDTGQTPSSDLNTGSTEASTDSEQQDTSLEMEETENQDSQEIVHGFDEWGYNYRAHLFKGAYENVSRTGQPVESSDTMVMIKWNDAYLSSSDCDGDGSLDPHCGSDGYPGSGAWLTNHVKWTYTSEDGQHKAQVFIKIVAKPSEDFDCASIGGVEVDGLDGFCEIQRVYNDPYMGAHGLERKADQSGLGGW